MEAFPDGVQWVTLGEDLSPLQLLSRIERLIYDLSGEQRGMTDLKETQAHLRSLIHPRRVLIVLEEAGDRETVLPFLQTGPGGSVLIITRNDRSLPPGTRSTPVDIMVTSEAVALLAAGLEDLSTRNKHKEPPPGPVPVPIKPAPFSHEPSGEGAGEIPPEQLFVDGTIPSDRLERLANDEMIPSLRQAEAESRLLSAGLSDEVIALLVDLAGRLNEWPLLLALVNGMLRGSYETGDMLQADTLEGAVRAGVDLLSHYYLDEVWAVNDPVARDRAVIAVVSACLEPLNAELRQRLFNLVVFPVDEEIPLAAVSVLWRTSPGETFETAARLAQRSLIHLDTAAYTIRLHPVLAGYINDHLRVGVLTALHRGLVEGYAERCSLSPEHNGPAGWATGPDDGYFFQHLGLHMAAAGQRTDLQNLLFDFHWLSAYLTCTNMLTGRRGDLYSLLLDFEIAHSVALDRQSAQLRLIEIALRMAAPVLTRDPGQLSSQLLGRLLPFEEPEIQGLLRQAEGWTDQPWLRPLSACFSTPEGDEVRIITGHSDWVTGLSILPDGQHALSGSLDGTLRWWDLANGQNTRTLMAHTGGVSAVAVTADGRKVVTSGWDGHVGVWDVISGETLLEFEAHNEPVGSLAITPDGLFLVTGSDDRLIRVWDLSGGKLLREMVGHGDPVRALAISPDGRMLASGSWDYTVRTWDLESGAQIDFFAGHEAWVRAIAFTPDGRSLLSGGWDRTIRVWDLQSGELAREIDSIPGPIFSLTLTPAADRLLVGTGDGRLLIYHYLTGVEQRELVGHTGGINQVAITREGHFAISASDDRTLRIWDLAALQIVHSQPGHSGPVYTLQAVPQSNLSVSGSWDGTLKVWDLATGAEQGVLSGHSGGIVALAVSADGRRAISGSRDHTIKVWNIAAREEERTLPGHAGTITTVSITPDGTWAASGADDGTLKVWNLEDGHCLAEFRGETAIWACSISHDGRTVVASETEGKMYFLEIKK